MTEIKGLKQAGNIDLRKRPVVKNDDGTISTVRSMSFEEDGLEILIPTVSDDGRLLDDEEAISLFRSSGRHLGKFDNPDDASAYAETLHQDQAKMYAEKPARETWPGWRLADVRDLPASQSAGPESWSEAWSKAAGTTDETMRVIENLDASVTAQRDAYQAYIDEVEAATGVRLKNPADVDLTRGAFDARPNPQWAGGTGTEWMEERIQAATDEFEAGRAKLAAQFPAQARLIELDLDERINRQMRDAQKQNMEALQSPELGMAGRLSAQLVGGLTGSARDPYQWMMAVTGAGSGWGSTVAGRIGSTMMVEALLNGGQEAVLQAASQERKKRAGLEHGLNDALANVGIAATFGALFGGTVQGGAELARIYKMGKGGEQIAARVLDGRPEPGDVEAMAKAMGVDLSPDNLALINRSFEERVLDDYMVSSDATPAQIEVMQAAERYATAPDNFPPPEIIERMLAEQEAGRILTMKPDDYERIYGGDQNAIDDISDTFFGDDVEAAARSVDAVADASSAVTPPVRPDVDDGVTVEAAPVATRAAVAPTDGIADAVIRPRTTAEPLDDAALRAAEARAGEISEPLRDLNGNPENYLDFIAVEDGDGVAKIMSVREALEMADEPDFLADVLEACKL